MVVARPNALSDALADLAANPASRPLMGGTDLMVAINFGRERPERVLALRRVPELGELSAGERVVCGAGVTFARLMRETADLAMLQAARTVGSPQIRNAGTLGGNLGTCSPAGDALPVLAALDADIVLASTAGERRLKLAQYMSGPKRSDLRPGELVARAEWNAAGPSQAFLKVGTRNAMVIAVANLALVIDRVRRRVGVALGSVGPTIVRPVEAEAFAAGLLDERGWDRPLRPSEIESRRFAQLVAEATSPIDDVRGSAAYRRHIAALMARRALSRAGASV